MTDEERKELVRNLQNYRPPKRINPAYGTALHIIAAEELERLAGQLQTTLVMYGERNKEIDRLKERVEQLQAQVTALSRM